MSEALVGLDGSTFFVSAASGDVEPGADASGYFYADMRHLSTWQLLADGEPLRVLSSGTVDYYSASIHATLARARVGKLLHDARPVLLNLGEPASFDIAPWADRVRLIDAKYAGIWELPVLGAVTASTAVLIRRDGYVDWVGERTHLGLPDALTTWFGPPTAA